MRATVSSGFSGVRMSGCYAALSTTQAVQSWPMNSRLTEARITGHGSSRVLPAFEKLIGLRPSARTVGLFFTACGTVAGELGLEDARAHRRFLAFIGADFAAAAADNAAIFHEALSGRRI